MNDDHGALEITEFEPGTTRWAGRRIDDERGRVFPCEECGADLTFHIGRQRLACPFCGTGREIELDEFARVEEQDFHGVLARLSDHRGAQDDVAGDQHEIRCDGCGANVVFMGTLTSTRCPYCASPLQRENVHDAETRVKVDGVLPFRVEERVAADRLKTWLNSRWFAPNRFVELGVKEKFNGVYLPFWTYDAMTAVRYTGQRGKTYWKETGVGKNKRRVRRTRWYAASGRFERFFDDVLVCAAAGIKAELLRKLEPWPLEDCVTFNQHMLSGFFSRTYDVELEDGFDEGRKRIEAALRSDVRRRIGGDKQRIHTMETRFAAITYKHLLLPCWLYAFRYEEKVYHVMINAVTGEVQGERPWSWWKIAMILLIPLAIFAVVAAIGGIVSAVGG